MNLYFHSDLARIVGDGGSHSSADPWPAAGRASLRSPHSRELGRPGSCSHQPQVGWPGDSTLRQIRAWAEVRLLGADHGPCWASAWTNRVLQPGRRCDQCTATAGWRGPNPLKRRFGSILPALAKHCSAATLGSRTVKMHFICKIMIMDHLLMLEILVLVLQSLNVKFSILNTLFLLFPTLIVQKSLPFNTLLMH